MLSRVTDYLLQEACPAIQYRIRRDLLGESTNEPSMVRLREGILTDPRVMAVFAQQQPDGFLGTVFHGSAPFYQGDPTKARKSGNIGAEGCIRFLAEMGLDATEPRLLMALKAVLRPDWFRERFGWIQHYPKLGLYGGELLQALVSAYLNVESALVVQQAHDALSVVCDVTSIHRFEDVIEPYQGKIVFKAGVIFPEIYHLKLLGHTTCWHNANSEEALAAAIARLLELSPLPIVKVRCGSKILGPAALYPADLKKPLSRFLAKDWANWFHTFELLARMGVVARIPELQSQLNELMEILDSDWRLFQTMSDLGQFCDWGPYRGLALETDWRGEGPRRDLLFRSLFILHYAAMRR